MIKKEFKITGMTCSACSARVEKAAKKTEGVLSAEVNLIQGILKTELDSDSVVNRVISSVEKAGYGIYTEEENNKVPKEKTKDDDELNKSKIRLITSFCFLIPLMLVSMGHMLGIPMPALFHDNPAFYAFVQLVLATPVVIINNKYFLRGFKNIFHGSPNMDSLVAIGSGAAYIYGIWAVFMLIYGVGKGNTEILETYSSQLYFESSAMILAFVSLGKYLEKRSVKKTGDAVKKLIELAPAEALILDGDKEVSVPVKTLKPGDIIIIKPGTGIPVDGTVIYGSSSVDTSALTGESVPVFAENGSRLSSGTFNINGYMKMRADKVGEDTTLSQIIKLVKEAGGSKAPVARFADKISGYFVPAVMAVSFISAVIWLLAGKGFEFSLSIAISVLVISCPCALGLATPVAIMVGTGVGALNGILFKNAEALEILHKTNTIILDKTGTLTEGKPVVTNILPENISEEELISFAAGLEKGSEHPYAKAIIKKAEETNTGAIDIYNINAIPGKGIQGLCDGKICLGGNYALMNENDIEPANNSALAEEGKTLLYFSAGGKYIGSIAVADKIKASAYKAVEKFKEMSVDVFMITGDNSVCASAVAGELGINNVISEVSPGGKASKINELKNAGKHVAMVGDGINDAPALSASDVGIAVSGGTDIAAESADVILMKDDPYDAAEAISLSRSVMKNIKMNLFWALFYNMLGIPIAAGVLYPLLQIRLSPMLGAIAMSLSSVCVVSNALRLRFWKPDKLKNKNIKENKKMTVYINGMMCNHCKATVEKALTATKGVKEVTVVLSDKKAVISGTATENDIKAAVTKAGYEVVSIEK